jgi:hypothetical protein
VASTGSATAMLFRNMPKPMFLERIEYIFLTGTKEFEWLHFKIEGASKF